MRINFLERLYNWVFKNTSYTPQYLSGKGRVNEG